MSGRSRPIGVTIIAILQGIGAILFILIGVLMAIAGFGITGETFADPLQDLVGQALTGVIIAFGVVFIVIGVLIFMLAKGLWNLSKTAWWIEIILYGLSVFSFLLNFETIAAQPGNAGAPIIAFIIFIYLILVRDAFY